MATFPFTKIWFGVELAELRPTEGTYGGEWFERLPAVAPANLDVPSHPEGFGNP